VNRPSARWVRWARTLMVLGGAAPVATGAQSAGDACCVPARAGVSPTVGAVSAVGAATPAVAAVLPPLLRGRGTARLAREANAGPAAAQTLADSLRVVRPMSGAERAVVALAATLSGVSWGLGGAAAGGAVGIGACLARRSDDDALDRLRGCRAAERWLVAGGMLGTLAGAASGAGFAARRLGCAPAESRGRAWRGAALGTLVAAVPAVAYASADDPNLLLGAALVLVVPTLQIGGAARQAGRCGLPVILR